LPLKKNNITENKKSGGPRFDPHNCDRRG
jgi:hypothetical protein